MPGPKPQPDAPKFTFGDFVRRRVSKSSVGQVVAIIFWPGQSGYRVQFAEDVADCYELELERAQEPHEWTEGAGAEEE